MSSYPRAGSSLMQQIINHFFEHPWTEVDRDRRPLERITGIPENFENWRYDCEVMRPKSNLILSLIDKINRRTIAHYNIEKWIAYYDLAVPPYRKNCRYLLPGCLNALTPANRRKLANEDTYYFVKTHWKPYKEYFENEYVIQMIRHPGKVIVSYFYFLKNLRKNSSLTLEDVIQGLVPYGNWSEWHESWQTAEKNLCDRFLQLRFEDVVNSDRIQTCEQIKKLIGLNYVKDKSPISFNEVRKINHNYYRGGERKDWKEAYNIKQFNLLKDFHGKQIKLFKYSIYN